MKNLRNAILATVAILISLSSFAQEQETITLVCSKKLDGAIEVLLDLDGEVTTEFWDKDYARVVIQIQSKGLSKEVVKHLKTKKRFDVSGMNINAETIEFYMPNINLPAFINGQEIHEELSFTLFLPHYTLVTMESDLIAENSTRPFEK